MKYQGWTNHATWLVKLWIDNDRPAYTTWRHITKEIWKKSRKNKVFTRMEVARNELSRRLKHHFENNMPSLKGFWQDLLQGAIEEVNWVEIAAEMLEED